MVVKLFSGLNFVCFSKILLLVVFCGQVAAMTPSESEYEKALITDDAAVVASFFEATVR